MPGQMPGRWYRSPDNRATRSGIDVRPGSTVICPDSPALLLSPYISLPLIDDGCANAGTDDDIDHAVALAAGAIMEFAEGGHFGVMIQHNGQTTERSCKSTTEGCVGYAGQIHQGEQIATVVVDGTRARRLRPQRGLLPTIVTRSELQLRPRCARQHFLGQPPILCRCDGAR